MFLLLDISSSQDTGISQIRGYNAFCNNIRYILWFYLYDSYQLLKKVKFIFRILLQETFVIYDCVAYDNGSTDTSLWASSTATIDRTSGEYTHFVGSGSSNAVMLVKNGVNDIFDYTEDLVIEFDGLNSNTSSIYIYQGSTSKGGISNPTSTDFVHIRIEYDATNQTIKLYKDNTQQGSTVSLNSLTSNFSIRFADWQGDMDFKLKNFKAYLR